MRISTALMFALIGSGCSTTPTHRASPDPKVHAAVTQAVIDYRDAPPYPHTVTDNATTGTIETDWFPAHKGEIQLKVEALVDGDRYKVDAWQRSSWGLLRNHRKTSRARRAESNIIERVERVLKYQQGNQ